MYVLSGLRIEFSPQIGVLKFPSPWWRTYAKNSAIPQTQYAPALLEEPEELACSLMHQLCIANSRHHVRKHRKPVSLAYTDLLEALRLFSGAVARRVGDAYGRDRWPLAPLLNYQYRRFRKQIGRSRGLNSD